MAQIQIGGAYSVPGGSPGAHGGQPDYENPRDATGDGLRVRLERSERLTEKGHLEQPFLFQCPPLETFSWSREYSHAEYETLRKGTYSRPQAKGLRAVQFNTLFVDDTWDWTLYRDRPGQRPNPLEYADELHHLLNTGTPFWLRVGQEQLWGVTDLEMLATLRSMTVEERAGEVDARYVDVSFVEYREADIERLRKGSGGDSRFPLKHVVRRGDTLANISKHYYGNNGDWKRVFAANQDRLGGHGLGPDTEILDALHVVNAPLTLTIPKPN